VNVAPDGTTNVQESGSEVVEEEHVVEEHGTSIPDGDSSAVTE